jgi:excisionase family DNA binding protein
MSTRDVEEAMETSSLDSRDRARSSRDAGAGQPERSTYTVDEVAEILGLSRSKTYDLVAQGEIPPVPLAGRRRLIARLTVEQLLASERPRH